MQRALDEAGIDYELVLEGSGLRRAHRRTTLERTGQSRFPWIEFEDGSVYRAQSKDMAAVIRAGRLDEQRGRPSPA